MMMRGEERERGAARTGKSISRFFEAGISSDSNDIVY